MTTTNLMLAAKGGGKSDFDKFKTNFEEMTN